MNKKPEAKIDNFKVPKKPASLEAFCPQLYLFPIIVRRRPNIWSGEAYYLMPNHLAKWEAITYNAALDVVAEHSISRFRLPSSLKEEFKNDIGYMKWDTWAGHSRIAPSHKYHFEVLLKKEKKVIQDKIAAAEEDDRPLI